MGPSLPSSANVPSSHPVVLYREFTGQKTLSFLAREGMNLFSYEFCQVSFLLLPDYSFINVTKMLQKPYVAGLGVQTVNCEGKTQQEIKANLICTLTLQSTWYRGWSSVTHFDAWGAEVLGVGGRGTQEPSATLSQGSSGAWCAGPSCLHLSS